MSGVQSEVRDVVSGSVNVAVQGINLGVVLAVALAWHAAIQMAIKTYVKVPGNAVQSYFAVAGITTVLAYFVFKFSAKIGTPSSTVKNLGF